MKLIIKVELSDIPDLKSYRPHGLSTRAPTAGTRAKRSDRSQGWRTFVNEAAYANRAEIAEARYVDHTKSQAVKSFAKQMIADHVPRSISSSSSPPATAS